MKSILFGLMLSAVLLISQAQDEAKPKEGDIKIYKRLIPADVLRGEFEDEENRSDCESSHVRIRFLPIRRKEKKNCVAIHVRSLDDDTSRRLEINNKNKSKSHKFHSIKLNSIDETVYFI